VVFNAVLAVSAVNLVLNTLSRTGGILVLKAVLILA
jgi:hypothetical protein